VTLSEMLKEVRDRGWMVGCHNDYMLNGKQFTYWMFTHAASGKYVHGEGETDERAVEIAMSLMPHRP